MIPLCIWKGTAGMVGSPNLAGLFVHLDTSIFLGLDLVELGETIGYCSCKLRIIFLLYRVQSIAHEGKGTNIIVVW